MAFALAIVGAVLGAIEVARSRGESLAAWGIVAVSVALIVTIR